MNRPEPPPIPVAYDAEYWPEPGGYGYRARFGDALTLALTARGVP